MYTIYTTDKHHSYKSFNLIGVATSFKKAIKLIKQLTNRDGNKLSKDDKFCLMNYYQTQNSNFDYEFFIEKINLNELV